MWKKGNMSTALTMPEPLQWWQCWTLVPGSWPLPSQRWQAASVLMDISLLTPFAAWVNVSSMTYCANERETEINHSTNLKYTLIQTHHMSSQKQIKNSHWLYFKLHLQYATNLLWLVKYSIEISKPTAPWEFPKDLAEELFWIHIAGLSCPVVLPSTSLTCIEACWAVSVILLPLYLITQDLRETQDNI